MLNDEVEKTMLLHTPIHRLGEPQDIANAALFLCALAAGWISGQILTVIAYLTLKAPKLRFWPNVLWLTIKHGVFAFGVIVSVAVA